MFDQLVCRVMFHQMRYEGIFTPPSEQGTLVFPGNTGMFRWGRISVDPNREVAIANPMALPFVSKLIPRGHGSPMEQPKMPKARVRNPAFSHSTVYRMVSRSTRSSHHLVCHVNSQHGVISRRWI